MSQMQLLLRECWRKAHVPTSVLVAGLVACSGGVVDDSLPAPEAMLPPTTTQPTGGAGVIPGGMVTPTPMGQPPAAGGAVTQPPPSTAGASAMGGAGGGAEPVPPGMAADFGVEGVATWRGNATSAYTIIHDDICNSSLPGEALETLAMRGMRVGLGIIVGACGGGNWDWLQARMEEGHEIVNHSWSHPRLTGDANLAREMDEARAEAEMRLDTQIDFFIFPFDAYDERAISHLREQGYLGARAGNYSRVVDPDFTDPFYDLHFEVYYTGDNATEYLDDGIASGGWALREMHGVADNSWEAAPLNDYLAHLDDVQERIDAGSVWMDAPTTVLKYRKARELCGAPTATTEGITFTTAAAEDCQLYATALSVFVTVPGNPGAVLAQQGEQMLPVKPLEDGRYLIDVNPAAGAARVYTQ